MSVFDIYCAYNSFMKDNSTVKSSCRNFRKNYCFSLIRKLPFHIDVIVLTICLVSFRRFERITITKDLINKKAFAKNTRN